MKSLKYLSIMLASLLMFACSSNDDEGAVPATSDKTKTISINLDGIVTNTLKSVSPNKSTAGVINLKDITILLTDGTNIYKKQLISSGSGDFTSAVGGPGLIFHEVDPAINKVIVLGNTAGESISYTNVASVKASIMKASDEQDKTDILLYGENTLTPGTEPNPGTHPTATTAYYTTTVNLNALVSRIEIGKIQCSNLGAAYSSFNLLGIGLVDISQQVSIGGANLSQKLSIYTGASSFGLIYEPGLATPPTGGLEFGVAPSLDWAYNAISPSTSTFTSSSSVYYAGGAAATNSVFAYNFIPSVGTFPNVKLHLGGVTTSDGSSTNFAWVSTKSFTGADNTHPKAGYIYQYDLVFNEINIGPFNPDSRICIGVNVTVSSWVIQALTPIFN